MAIGISVTKAPDRYDLGASKFFGTPTIPGEWLDDFSEDEIFFCQIRLSDIAELDKENRLPHKGYLYVFLHTEGGERHLSLDLRYRDKRPTHALEGFNMAVTGYENWDDAYLMAFSEVAEDFDGTRLFGTPSDWPYGDEPKSLLLQYDPLDSDMGFLDSLDGYLYLFFGEDEKDLAAVTLHEEYT